MNATKHPPILVWVMVLIAALLALWSVWTAFSMARGNTTYVEYPAIMAIIALPLGCLAVFGVCLWLAFQVQNRQLEFWHYQELELNKQIRPFLAEKVKAPDPDQAQVTAAHNLLEEAKKALQEDRKTHDAKLDQAVNDIKELLKK
jgi:type VI protein secretion system component VasK